MNDLFVQTIDEVAYDFIKFAQAFTTSAIRNSLKGWASEPENRYAGVGYESSAVWEEWAYPTGTWIDYPRSVGVASGSFDLLWRFNKDSADTFQIKTTAWVNWGENVKTPGSEPIGTPDKYNLVDCEWTQESITFTVYA